MYEMVMMVRWIEGRRAKVAGRCVIAYGKFHPSGIKRMSEESDLTPRIIILSI